jgi:hypothetical protein
MLKSEFDLVWPQPASAIGKACDSKKSYGNSVTAEDGETVEQKIPVAIVDGHGDGGIRQGRGCSYAVRYG